MTAYFEAIIPPAPTTVKISPTSLVLGFYKFQYVIDCYDISAMTTQSIQVTSLNVNEYFEMEIGKTYQITTRQVNIWETSTSKSQIGYCLINELESLQITATSSTRLIVEVKIDDRILGGL